MAGIEIKTPFQLWGDEVSLEQAEALRRQGFDLIDTLERQVEVDLAHVERANSVTVALLLAWQRRASLQGKSIIFLNLSDDLRNIIEFSGLTQVLGDQVQQAP